MRTFPILLAATLAAWGGPSEVGLTSKRNRIECLHGAGALEHAPGKKRLLLIGGLDGSSDSASAARSMFDWFEKSPRASKWRKQFSLSAVASANPDRASLQFPPSGEAYRTNTESHYLWRWIQVYAPDQVLIVGAGAGLGEALKEAPAVAVDATGLAAFLEKNGASIRTSALREEASRRLNRTPREVATQLARVYGHELPEAVYIPAVALIARVRLGDTADVERIVELYVSGKKDSLEKATSSHLSGHLIFSELALRTHKPGYTNLVRKVADMAFTSDGRMKESMPLHNEMSDSVFMGVPILASAGKLTGESKYFDMAVRHYEFMKKLDLRPDGIYRHSPLDEAAWGRGNAFPALGVALALADLPPGHAGHAAMLADFRRHMAALAKFQTAEGMWRQVVDLPGSYPELSATCMIAYSMLRGIEKGWLDKKTYQPIVDRAWKAVKLRAGADGSLIDVCTGTGKQKSVQDYLERTAILGKDPRGGAMVLLLATALMR